MGKKDKELEISQADNNNEKEDKKGKGKGKKNKDEKDEAEKPAEPQLPPVPYTQLFRYASVWDKILFVIGFVAAAASGITMPGMVILFGQITDTMVSNANPDPCVTSSTATTSGVTSSVTFPSTTEETLDTKAFLDKIAELSLYQVLLGTGQLIVGYFFITCFNIISENLVYTIRQKYLAALLRQNVGWYDTNQDRNFVSRIAEDAMKVQDATGEKVGLCIFFMSTSLLSLGNAFYHGWLLTLVVLASAPALAIAAGVVTTIQSRLAATEQTAYAKAGTVAEEAITNIRTVLAFGGQSKETTRYEKGLEIAQAAGKKRGAVSGFGMGVIWMIMYGSYALAFWYGTKLILDGVDEFCETGKEPAYTAQNMLIVFFSVLMGAFNIGQSASYFESFAIGRGSAAGIYAVIDRVPEIDSYSEAGEKPKGKATGRIKFENVKFHYPSRPEVQILNGLNLSIEPEQTIALVGHSGCGKSTCLQLLQRFYDPIEGRVLVDGIDVKDLHIGWLRSQIGIVSQEPVLFNATIAENIRYGRDGVTDQEIEDACRQANAHQFISKLPDGYKTQVGDRGAQLSGGQKQRVAIARALVRNPSILLLDEATSALDTQSESIVQAALDRARKGRTTLIVAHRLSTIRAADLVVSISEGQVSEKGNHQELLKNKGLYYTLVTAQMNSASGGDDDDDVDMTSVDEHDPARRHSRKSIPHEEEVVNVAIVTEDSLSEKELAKEAPLRRLLAMNMPEWKWMVSGTICAMIQGSVLPLYAIIFGEFLGILADPEADKQAEANKYALYFVGIGLVSGLSMFLQMFAFSLAGEALTRRLRRRAFVAMMDQEPGWYDDPSNNIGALCARLSGDAASVQGATGTRVGTVVQSLATIVLAIILSIYYSPKLGAVALAFVPIVGVTTYLGGGLMTGQNIKEKKAVEESSKVAVQAVSNIRTVASLTREKSFVKMYDENLQGPHKMIVRRAHLRGAIFGFSQALPLYAYGAVLYYGAYLTDKGEIEYQDIFKVAESLIFGTMMVGQTLAFAPNYTKAKISGSRILRLLDRKPAIENSPGVGLQIKNAQGSVKFDQVAFSYPTRPTAKILRQLSAYFEPGKKVAIVGPSGSGKSTCIQLILRFYDPLSGQVKLDDTDVAALNVDALRSQMAIVAQEPALFDRTLSENIAYGDNSRTVSMEEVIEAARQANIHSFISGLPAGYETRVGEMGTQLSGGQKQRVAIARALVRNPKVLLLDEATSALDMESEQVVQAALETASEGRTSITIAHRLASIQNVDKILVVNNGELAESGTHHELLQKQGIYHRLWNMQGSGQRKAQKDD